MSSEPQQNQLSDEQRAVIAFETDLVVSAGAGSGKTRTLVGLYARAVEAPADYGLDPEEFGPARVLCLTFTERAARDIRKRVRERLSEGRYLRELETASITTFHAWCAHVLRDHPLEAGMDPGFSVLTAERADELLSHAAIEVLRRGIDTGDEAARRAVMLVGLIPSADRLTELVREIRTAGWEPRRAIERFEQRLDEVQSTLDGPLADAVDDALSDLLDAVGAPNLTTQRMRDCLEQARQAAAIWRAARSDDAAAGLIQASKFAARSWRFDGAKALRHALEGAADTYREAAGEIGSALQIGIWPALTESVRDAYRNARRARNAFDYDDLLLRARSLLAANGDILRAYRRRYRLVLIDEHQDTDPVQNAILELLLEGDSGAPNEHDPNPRWCVVGDGQQSIYGFRGATVEAFTSLTALAGKRHAHRSLTANYRARGELVALHNALFGTVFDDAGGTVRYLEQHPHRPENQQAALDLILPSTDHPATAGEGREVEARALAARLAAAVTPGDPMAVEVIDEAGPRPATAGDVVVLLRRLTQVETYRRALETVGLESIVIGSGSFYARQEVFDVLNALEGAILPHDPVPLVAFLRSPMVGLSDDAIYRTVRGHDKNTPLLGHLHRTADREPLDARDRQRLANGLEILDGLSERADREPPGATVAWLVDRTGYAAVLDALPDRTQRRANLDRLISLADQAAAGGDALLTNWSATIRRRVDRPPRDRDAGLPEVGPRVRLMSIHQSKGLEFPIVALVDLGGQPRSGVGSVVFDRDYGIVARRWSEPGTRPAPTLSHTLAASAARERGRAEEARLLYVAATRARDHLIMSAGGGRHWWLDHMIRFAGSSAAEGLVDQSSLGSWSGRRASVVGRPPPLPDGGMAYAPAIIVRAGEHAARSVAAAMAGDSSTPGSPTAAARQAGREALRRGALGHRALERIPIGLDRSATLEWLDAFADFPEPDREALAALVAERVGPKLENTEVVHRERPFRLHLAAGGGTIVGAIDCLFYGRDTRWHVWDYKFARHDGSAAARHEAQLGLYALAVAAIEGCAPHGRLWYISNDGVETRDMAWSDDTLAALADTASRAIRCL